MKLRRLRLSEYRNLQSVDIRFSETTSTVPGKQGLPVYILLGVNGTGKTGILRALGHIFSCLENRESPSIVFGLNYQIGRGAEDYEVEVQGDGRASLESVQFQVTDPHGETRDIDAGEWSSYLPTRTIIYTSGDLNAWNRMLAANTEGEEALWAKAELLEQQQDGGRTVQELTSPAELMDYSAAGEAMEDLIAPRTRLFTEEHLHLALLATLAIDEQRDTPPIASALEHCAVYRRAGVERLSRFALRLEPLSAHATHTLVTERVGTMVKELLGERLQEDDGLKRQLDEALDSHPPVLPQQLSERIRQLASLASHRHRNPDGSYHLLFDMSDEVRHKISGSQGSFATPEQFFDFLVDLQDRGVLKLADLVIQKVDLPDETLVRHLSDGEFEFLGRMALFLLLRQPESLFLLDEPETHFNDVWKRELVDLLSTILEGRNSTVLMSTHSSIVISDVAHPQLILLVKDEQGQTKVVDVKTPTFGADPSDVAVNVLGAPRAGGSRSARQIAEALQRGDRQELEALLEIVSPGYWRFRIRDRLESLYATPN